MTGEQKFYTVETCLIEVCVSRVKPELISVVIAPKFHVEGNNSLHPTHQDLQFMYSYVGVLKETHLH